MITVNGGNAAKFTISAVVLAVGLIAICAGGANAQGTCKTTAEINSQRATLSEADLIKERDCWVAKLKGGEKNLAGAFLPEADLSLSATNANPNYEKVDFEQAYLARTNFTGANLYGASMNEAYLGGAILIAADLRNAKLRGAIMTQADLTNAKIRDADFSKADLRDANLTGCNFLSLDDLIKARFPDQEEWKHMPGADKTAIKKDLELNQVGIGYSATLTGATISANTKGTNAAYWKSRGGVVVD